MRQTSAHCASLLVTSYLRQRRAVVVLARASSSSQDTEARLHCQPWCPGTQLPWCGLGGARPRSAPVTSSCTAASSSAAVTRPRALYSPGQQPPPCTGVTVYMVCRNVDTRVTSRLHQGRVSVTARDLYTVPHLESTMENARVGARWRRRQV